MTAILGGGIAGLSAAYYALENPKLGPIVLLEASNRIGGWIRSQKFDDGTVFECGPRSVRVSLENPSKNILNMVEDLQLNDKVIGLPRSSPASKNLYIYANKKLCLLPNRALRALMPSALFPRPLAFSLWTDYRAPKVIKEDESVYSFIERRLGKNVADNIFSPLICGIYAGDAKQISARSAMKALFEGEQEHGSIVKGLLARGMTRKKNTLENDGKVNTNPTHLTEKAKRERWGSWTLRGGLEQLPSTLANNLHSRGVNLQMERKCERLFFKPDGVEVTVNGEVEKYSRIISCLPARNLALILREQHPQLAQELEGIFAATACIVNLQFSRDVLKLNTFGYLVRPQEGIPILGVSFDSKIFPQNSTTVLTVIMGGAWYEKYFDKEPSKEHLFSIAFGHVKDTLHINEDPIAFNAAVLKDCIPQHVVGHTQRLKRIQDYISTHKMPLVLCGSSYQSVGIPDVILHI